MIIPYGLQSFESQLVFCCFYPSLSYKFLRQVADGQRGKLSTSLKKLVLFFLWLLFLPLAKHTRLWLWYIIITVWTSLLFRLVLLFYSFYVLSPLYFLPP